MLWKFQEKELKEYKSINKILKEKKLLFETKKLKTLETKPKAKKDLTRMKRALILSLYILSN